MKLFILLASFVVSTAQATTEDQGNNSPLKLKWVNGVFMGSTIGENNSFAYAIIGPRFVRPISNSCTVVGGGNIELGLGNSDWEVTAVADASCQVLPWMGIDLFVPLTYNPPETKEQPRWSSGVGLGATFHGQRGPGIAPYVVLSTPLGVDAWNTIAGINLVFSMD